METGEMPREQELARSLIRMETDFKENGHKKCHKEAVRCFTKTGKFILVIGNKANAMDKVK